MSASTPTDPSPRTPDEHPLAWWTEEPPPPSSQEDSDYDADLYFDEPEPYDDWDGYEADRAADRYEAWLFREPY